MVKRILGLGGLLLLSACSQSVKPAPGLGTAAAPTELFFSEYVEGSGNNKALEIYNGTGAAVDLASGGYAVDIYFNGSTSASTKIPLEGSVAAKDVFVLADNDAATPVLDVADQTSTASFFNGDDAIVLRKGTTVLDVIGQIGTDPGSAWGTAPTSTQNNTLRRKESVMHGDADGNDAFDPAVEWDGFATDTFAGLGSYGDNGGTPPGACQAAPAVTLISAVQGATDTTPCSGQTVSVEGVVVGDFEGPTALRGFYIEEEQADWDADAATSEGLFVFNGDSDSVSVGQRVRVTGRVSEFGEQTQITASNTEILEGGPIAVPKTSVTLPVASLSDLEAYEGMLVTFPQSLVISEYFNYDRFGELVLAAPPADLSRLYTPTSYVNPGAEAVRVAELNARSRITLDDGLGVQNPEVTRHPNGQPFSLTNRFRGGDTVMNAVGVLDYRFGAYRVQPTQGADYTVKNPRTAAPDNVGGSLKVSSFNVLNYFTTLDNGSNDARGADDAEEFTRQQAKIVSALAAIDADVFGLIEIENNGDVAVQNLTDALNARVGAGTYSFVATGTIGTDAIKVALLYKPSAVTPVGNFALLDNSVDPRFIDTKNRPALIQTFDAATGGRFTVAVNHFKSKGSSCGAGDDDPQQGNCNETRTKAAAALVDYLATDPTGSGDPDVLIVGDLNSYDKEDPIRTLQAGGYTDLNRRFGGEFAYSYGFDGQFGYLDYGLSSPTLTDQITGTTDWHINADEPDLLDYDTSFKSAGQDAIYAPDPYRASDHDPVVVGLELTTPDPAILLNKLISDVQALGLKRGDEQKLLAQLETAQRHLQRGRVSQADAALGRFERQVAKLAAKGTLSAEQRDAFIAEAEAIRKQL